MKEEKEPDYIQTLLKQAEQAIAEKEIHEALGYCFRVLADYPEQKTAAFLIHQALRDEWLVQENRRAIGRPVDEWDDRPWQHRRRLALSFRLTSRWGDGYDAAGPFEAVEQADVRDILSEGRDQLLQDYLLGQSKGSEMAWLLFQAAIERTGAPYPVMLWIAHFYAEQGYFAEAADVAERLLVQFRRQENVRLLWAEVCWWRDNQQNIPWLPPAEKQDGRRYRRLLEQTDPAAYDALDAESVVEYMPPDWEKLPPDLELAAPTSSSLIADVKALLSSLPDEIGERVREKASSSPIDWSYLDQLTEADIDPAQFPEWVQYILLEVDNPAQEAFLKRYFLMFFADKQDEEE